MQWKSEYVGLILLSLFGLSLIITAIRIARLEEVPSRFRKGLVFKLLSLFLFLVFIWLYLASSRLLFVWLGLFFLGLSIGASKNCMYVIKKDRPEIWRDAWGKRA